MNLAPGTNVHIVLDRASHFGRIIGIEGGYLKYVQCREAYRPGFWEDTGNVICLPWPWWEAPVITKELKTLRIQLRTLAGAGRLPRGRGSRF